MFGDDGFTFGDLIDIVNPLQHIPVVSNIYRSITGDTIAPAMEIAGGALFGGPLGALFSVASVVVTNLNTNDIDPEANPSGVDPATVAGTYPFQDYTPDNNSEIVSTIRPVKTGQYNGDGIFNPAAVPQTHSLKNNNIIAGNSHAVTSGKYNGDGIFNPAAVDNNSIARLDIKELNNEKDLYAGVNIPQTKPVTTPNALLINNTYKNNSPLINLEQKAEPMIDIVIGAPADAG